jgi:very-short-patch-repair endonuclease
MRIKASDKMKTVWSNTDFASRLMRNGKTIFTSKSEVEIREHFIKNFPIDEWTFGGCIRFNGIGIVRDLYSKVLKICIEYDGIWHFKDIHGQLETKKLKDKALEEWCLCNGWRLIRIDEIEYLKDCHGALQKLVELAYKCEDKIVKIGDRY